MVAESVVVVRSAYAPLLIPSAAATYALENGKVSVAHVLSPRRKLELVRPVAVRSVTG